MKFRKWFKNRVLDVKKLYISLGDDYDVEMLHNYRINLRKLYACSEVYAKKIDEKRAVKLSRLLKNMLKPTAKLRDLDLFINEIGAMECKLNTKEKLLNIFNLKREKAFKKYKNILKSSSYKKSLKKLKLIAKKSDFFIYDIENLDNYKVIKNKQKSIYSRYNKIDADTSFKELHELRKEFKKLRYGVNIYERCFKNGIKDLSDNKNLQELQNIFGAIQDNCVRLELIKSIKEELCKEEQVKLGKELELKLKSAKEKLFTYRDNK